MIYTFWEGRMPTYIKLCLDTWKFPYVLLDYSNVNKYTDIPGIVKTYPLQQVADYVRVHVLRDNGGYWLDADTIMMTDELPTEMILGDNKTRMNTIGFLHTEPNSDMFTKWAEFQDAQIRNNVAVNWDIFGNRFTDEYLKTNDIKIGDIKSHWPELIESGSSRMEQYIKFYFYTTHEVKTGFVMLHNSWTPDWYKRMTEDELKAVDCTMSKLL